MAVYLLAPPQSHPLNLGLWLPDPMGQLRPTDWWVTSHRGYHNQRRQHSECYP